MAITNLRELFSNWYPRSKSLLSARPHPDQPPLIPQLTPLTMAMLPPRVIPTPVTHSLTHFPPPPRVATPLTTIRDVLANQKMPLTDRHPAIPSSPILRRSPRVYQSPEVSTPSNQPTPIAHQTRSCLKVSPLSASSRTFTSEFLQGWAASEVLHGNQWSPLALSVLDPETGQSLEHRYL